jgi:hypothetical protein
MASWSQCSPTCSKSACTKTPSKPNA